MMKTVLNVTSRLRASVMQESPRNTPDSLQALHKSAGAMRKLQAELKRAAAASPWAAQDQLPTSSPAPASMALVPVDPSPPPLPVSLPSNQVSLDEHHVNLILQLQQS